MSDYAGWINGGASGAEALGKLWGKLFTPGSATILTPSAYQVTQRAAGANMSVDIAIGSGLSDLPDYSIPVWSSAAINKTVTAADPTNPRNDIVVRYVNLAAYGTNNNQGATQFIIVSGTPAGIPSDPSSVTIQAAVGAGNPWEQLARITVPANATSIVNAYITDLRVPIAFAGNLWGGSSNTKGHTIPNIADDTLALLSAAQTLQHKTIDNTNTVQSSALSNPYKFSAYRNGAWTATAGLTLITFDTETFDTSSNYSVSTGKFTAPVAGFYFFSAAVSVGTVADTHGGLIGLYKNGTLAKPGQQGGDGDTQAMVFTVSGLLQLAANDYVQVYAGGDGNAGVTGAAATFFDGFLVSET